MLISMKRIAKLIKNGIEEVHRVVKLSNMSQRSITIYSYILGTLSGILIATMVIKYLQFEELLQETTRPMYDGLHEQTSVATLDLSDEVRILCFVLTYPPNHNTKATAVKQTWGKRCNKLLFVSTDLHDDLDVVLVNVTEERRYLWGKTKSGLQQIYDSHGSNYDWFLKADDDTWMFMENLRYFLYEYSPDMPIYFGCKLKPYVAQGYMSGSGYVMSREALRRFNKDALTDEKKCWNGVEGNEDVEVGKCLANVGVLAGDSRDDLGRSRFLPFPPDGLLRNLFGETWLDNATFYEIKKGSECCSTSVISFHYITYQQMYVIDYVMYTVKLSSNNNKLPRKLDIAEVRRRLDGATTPSVIEDESGLDDNDVNLDFTSIPDYVQ